MNPFRDILLVGRLLIDRYYMLKDFPVRGQDAVITNSFERVGGCTYNAAATIKNLGGNPLILSPVCSDERGKWIQSTLLERKFREDLLFPMDGDTEYCVVLLDGEGERTFLTYSGSKFLITDDMMQAATNTQPAYVHLSGYSLIEEENAGRIVTLLERLKADGSKLFFDPSPLCGEIERDVLKKVIFLSDVFCPNKVELQAIERYLDLSLTSPVNLGGSRLAVVKDGIRGATAYTADGPVTVPAFPLTSVDGTGAGDSFAGGLLFTLAQGYDLIKAVRIASACGGLTAGRLGPQADFTLQDVELLIEKNVEL
jgi:sugar/nucleoside kinase (ribokinase family)